LFYIPGAFPFPGTSSLAAVDAERTEMENPLGWRSRQRGGADRTGPVVPRRTERPFHGASMPLRMRVHDREPIGAALRRFKKLLERSGLQKELRKRKHYEKPCEVRRRAKLRKQSAIRKAKSQDRKA
jgi:small subunit ribosomal protein S21